MSSLILRACAILFRLSHLPTLAMNTGEICVWGPKLLVKLVLDIVTIWIRTTAFNITYTKIEGSTNLFYVDPLGRKFLMLVAHVL